VERVGESGRKREGNDGFTAGLLPTQAISKALSSGPSFSRTSSGIPGKQMYSCKTQSKSPFHMHTYTHTYHTTTLILRTSIWY
jgi:hypothetical protein